MPKDPTPALIRAIEAKRDAAETECNNINQQIARSQQFLNELTTKLVHAQGRYAAHVADLEVLAPPEKPNAATTPTP